MTALPSSCYLLNMKFEQPVLKGKFIKRYKRFFADIEYNGEVITALVPNTGSLKTCLFEGADCYFTVHDDPKRKLKYTLQMLKTPKSWVGVNTHLPNKMAFELWQSQTLEHWSKFDCAQMEVKINQQSRLDLVLWKASKAFAKTKIKTEDLDEHKFHFVEIKNVTMVENGVAKFPDAVTTRGQKHINELTQLIDRGHTAELLFVVQRKDAEVFSAAAEVDPAYANLLMQAVKKGLRVTPVKCDLNKNQILLNPKQVLPLQLS